LVATEPISLWVKAAKAATALKIDSFALHGSSSPLQDAQGTSKVMCKLVKGEALWCGPMVL
jgi:hypothetical protein